ncbi:hypothetical protein CBR_g37422 [Chara braunii]|uniref:Uncharacterized protein n=1 Tax=Chara braunii TaxID=69332 RepID=A0A388LMS1_CHABU|nr:hypothetical protein CBR_g37422 [Chara braunii]|eukprot:GBG83618.1 hypothetical protein CBR_g37422 [Chara braunii]
MDPGNCSRIATESRPTQEGAQRGRDRCAPPAQSDRAAASGDLRRSSAMVNRAAASGDLRRSSAMVNQAVLDSNKRRCGVVLGGVASGWCEVVVEKFWGEGDDGKDGDKGDASCVEDEATAKRLLVKGCEGYGMPA